MPSANPIIGEVWATTDATGRSIRAIVSDITDAMVTLVSFTGNRFRLAPPRLTGSWHFVESPPNTRLFCTSRGCQAAGILTYIRGTTSEWVCARHLPVGVRAAMTTESIGGPVAPTLAAQPVEAPEPTVRCHGCGNTNPLPDLRVELPTSAELWQCGLCNERWCLIRRGTLPLESENLRVVMFDILNDVRARLAVENFRVEEISTNLAWVYSVFDGLDGNAHRGASVRPLYAGIPIALGQMLSPEPTNTILRLRLTGGPEYRTAPRRMRTDRNAAMSAGFDLAYGGQRDADGNIVGTPVGNMGMIGQRPRATTVEQAQAAYDLLDEMAPPYVSQGTRWVNRSNGEVVEVDHLGASTDNGETVVHFRRVSDDMEVNLVLLLRDFESMFRPFTHETPRSTVERVAEVLKDEEWEHIESLAVVRIDTVDTKRNLVVVLDKEKRRSVNMIDFVNGKWRKIIRRTAYARLLDLEDD